MGKKKNYSVLLDIETTEAVRKDLEKKGMNLSAFIRATINEYRENMEILNPKNLGEMTVQEFLKTMSEFAAKMSEPASEEEVKRIEEKLKD